MTRLVWLIIFALLIGAIVIISLKSLPGARVNQRLVEIEQARETLSRMFPDSRFRVQFSTPNPGVRNLVITIQPGRTDSSAVAAQVDSAESVIRRRVDLTGYDSLVVAVFDHVYRAAPTR
jgi:predicted deacylase